MVGWTDIFDSGAGMNRAERRQADKAPWIRRMERAQKKARAARKRVVPKDGKD